MKNIVSVTSERSYAAVRIDKYMPDFNNTFHILLTYMLIP